MKPSKIDHVGLIVRDLDTAEAFLMGVFGVEPAGVEPNPGTRARFYRAGDITIQLVEDEQRLRGAPIARLDHICLQVDDIDEVMAVGKTHGAEFVWDEPLVHREGQDRTQFITDRGGLGVIFQLNDHRGSPEGRQVVPADRETLSRAMADRTDQHDEPLA